MTVRRMLLCALAMLPLAMTGSSQDLQLDGKVRIRGASLEGTRVVMLSEDGDEMVLKEGSAHFIRTLRTNTRYLLSVERTGCVTKQLIIDTHLPEHQAGSRAFTFAFLITLGLVPRGQPFEYAGPVGYVRYMEALGEFGYDTDYRIKPDSLLQRKLERFDLEPMAAYQPEVRMATGSVIDVTEPIAPLPAPQAHDAPEPTIGTSTAPTSHETLPSNVVVVTKPPPSVLPTALVKPAIGKDWHPAHLKRTVRHDVRLPDSRLEWTQVEPRRVTTIVRITREGRMVEYRRVAHQYGTVFYFIDGHSCSELRHTQGVNGSEMAH